MRVTGGGSELPPAKKSGRVLQAPTAGPGLSYFRNGFNNHQLVSITRYSPIIFASNFNDFAFVLDITVFGQVGLKSQKAGPKPEQVG